jgi:Flp pilus assembly protein TadB
MSKARAQARAAREAETARRRAEEQQRQAKVAAQRAKRERRSLAWRHLRLWQHGSGFSRRKEGWAALATLAMVLILLAFLLTDSLSVVLLVVLVLIIGAPVLVMLTFDRRSK